MTERRLSREAAQLRERLGPSVCAHPAPCQTATVSEARIMPGGHEVRTGAEPRPLCEGCPNREAQAVRHVEVRLDYRNRHGYEVAPSAARTAYSGHEEGPGERGTPPTLPGALPPF